jgi:RNA polymerase sigma factor (sigma-70 family)
MTPTTADGAGPGTTAWSPAADAFAAWRAGDRDGLERLVRLLTPALWHVARAYGLDRQSAEDVVQSTLLALVRNADSIREPQAVWRWSTVTAKREAWRVHRAGSREQPVEPADLDGAGPPVPGPEAAVVADDAAVRLWALVARLPELCRRLLRVIAFEQRPNYAAVAAELGRSVGSIGPTRGRCLDKLRRLIADDAGWSDR